MRIKYRTREALVGLSFVLIWIIGFAIFTLYPLIQTFWFSLNEIQVTAEGIKTNYIGLLNYKNAFLMDVTFGDLLITYFLQMLIYVPVILVFSMTVSLLLNMNIKGKGLFRTIYFLPVIITSGPVMKQLMDQGATTFPGLQQLIERNQIQQTFPPVIANLISFLLSSFIMILWFSGVQILIFLAGLQKIDKSMYEAASIDGASKWQVLWKLILPAMNSMIIINIIYTVVMVSIFSLNPIVLKIQNDMYQPGLGLGYSSALAWIYFLVMLLIMGIFLVISVSKDKKKRVMI
ncbi:sugar ABC transporter permease [Caloramator sp. CAR-1]|uniref:carbohydrate ABC transporter permease n=1 Tax=Caloramator sp. CAR-1 TaxID=3062777 RepID=UPI0026E3F149|nr:sugar ABC transporter permease [Caloramator sp. CAR-1]MDO6356032.1 sugar ABC transporter permease [Caloramator sp. CAR-1]